MMMNLRNGSNLRSVAQLLIIGRRQIPNRHASHLQLLLLQLQNIQQQATNNFTTATSHRLSAVGGTAHHHHRQQQLQHHRNLNRNRKTNSRFRRQRATRNRHQHQRPTSAAVVATSSTSSSTPYAPTETSLYRPYRSPTARFLNPWVDLANVTTDDTLLSFKIDSVTRTFGVVAALMCSLSAAALAVTPSADDEELEQEKRYSSSSTSQSDHDPHVSGSSLLVRYWGIPARTTHDLYTGCCAGAFYSSVGAMGLSAVINAWLAATPVGGTRHFVRYHSLAICAIPGLLAISTGLAGVSLFIGLDRSKGTPISYIGLGGTLLGGLLIGSSTVRGMICTYRLLTPLVMKKF